MLVRAPESLATACFSLAINSRGVPLLLLVMSDRRPTQQSSSPAGRAAHERSQSDSLAHAMDAARLLLEDRVEFRELLAGVFTVMRNLPSHELRDLCFAILVRHYYSRFGSKKYRAPHAAAIYEVSVHCEFCFHHGVESSRFLLTARAPRVFEHAG